MNNNKYKQIIKFELNTNTNLLITIKVPDIIKIFNTYFYITKNFKLKKIDNLIIQKKYNYVEIDKVSAITKLFNNFYKIILSNTCLKNLHNNKSLIKFISPQFARLTIEYFLQYCSCIITNDDTNLFRFKNDNYKLNYVLKKFKLYKDFDVIDDIFDYDKNLALSYFHAGIIILPRCFYDPSLKKFRLVYNYNKINNNDNDYEIYDDYITSEELENIFFHELVHIFCNAIELKTILYDIDRTYNYEYNFCEENLVDICAQELSNFLRNFKVDKK